MSSYPHAPLLILAMALMSPAALVAQTLNGPESLDYDASANRYLISNRSAGQILARSSAGVLSVFTNDPSSPAGLEIVGEHVFIADGGFIRGYRLSDGVRVVNYAISGATFLNGLASDGGERLWTSDFNLETLVGRGRVCGYGCAGLGAMRRNSSPIPTSCNAAMRGQNRAICPVAYSPNG